MKNIKSTFKRFMDDENGATAIEYALLAALIGIAIVGGARTLGTALNDSFADTTNEFPD